MTQLAADLQFRRLVHQTTDAGVLGSLDRERLTAYIGFDPTAPSLHVGSLLQLCTLRRLQQAGHRPIALAGGGTGLIGDPGGKTAERDLVTLEQVKENLGGIKPQLERFLDFDESAGPVRALLVDNGDWLASLGLVEFLREVGKHFTVNQMVGKESVRARLERPEQGISYAEFTYMLLQAYDFLRLHLDHGCELQLGGSDQWGNITMGVELVRKVAGGRAYGITTPLVTKADGSKFGKTEEGNVWLDAERTSPYRLYQFFVNTEDAVVGDYLRYFTFLSRTEIEALDQQCADRPEARAAQTALAREVCTLVHGQKETRRAEQAAKALFGETDDEVKALDERTFLQVVGEAPSSVVPRAQVVDGGLPLVDALRLSGLVTSKGQARRLISQGGVYVNNRRETDLERMLQAVDLVHDHYIVLRKGRREYHLFQVE